MFFLSKQDNIIKYNLSILKDIFNILSSFELNRKLLSYLSQKECSFDIENLKFYISNDLLDVYSKVDESYLFIYLNSLQWLIKNYEQLTNGKVLLFDGRDFFIEKYNDKYLNYLGKDIYIFHKFEGEYECYGIYATNNYNLLKVFNLIEESFFILRSWPDLEQALEKEDREDYFWFDREIPYRAKNKNYIEILSDEGCGSECTNEPISDKAIYTIHKDAFYNLTKKHFDHMRRECEAGIRCSKTVMTIHGKESNIEFID